MSYTPTYIEPDWVSPGWVEPYTNPDWYTREPITAPFSYDLGCYAYYTDIACTRTYAVGINTYTVVHPHFGTVRRRPASTRG